MTDIINTPWQAREGAYKEALTYVKDRAEGKEVSLITPWHGFNDAGLSGLEFYTTTVVAARPANGKTVIKDQLIRESRNLNSSIDFNILDFSLEMPRKMTVIREFSSVAGKTYKDICSGNGRVSDELIQKCEDYANSNIAKDQKHPVHVVDTSCSVKDFSSAVINYMNFFSTTDELGNRKYKKTLITLDHSGLLRKASPNQDSVDKLYAFADELMSLRKKYPIAFFILAQLNRLLHNSERSENGKYTNYVVDEDILGSDALLQCSEIIVGITRPALRHIKYYGPKKFVVNDDPTLLAAHFIKCRNGDPRLSWFTTDYAHGKLLDRPEPPVYTSKF